MMLSVSSTADNTGAILESIVLASQTPTTAQQQSRNAMKQVLKTQANTEEGAYRKDIGWIAFLWGTPGAEPLFADGNGLARIIAKQDFEKKFLTGEPSGSQLCLNLVDIITRGRIKRRYGTTNHPLIDITWQGEIAVIGWDGGRKAWYLTAWRKDWGGILESAANDDSAADNNNWENSIRSAKSFEDIYSAFKVSGLIKGLPENVADVVNTFNDIHDATEPPIKPAKKAKPFTIRGKF